MRSFLGFTLLFASSCAATPQAEPVRTETVDLKPTDHIAAPSLPASSSSARPTRPTSIDTASLTPREQDEYSDVTTDVMAPCDNMPVSLAQCLKENRSCNACAPAARFVVKQIQLGKEKSDTEALFHARFDSQAIKSIAVDGSPTLGPNNAAETIVVWADFECPMCAGFEPLLEQIVRRFPTQARLVFKNYPLSKHHLHAENAARAAFAAMNQGKFWEMDHELFAHQDSLEQSDLEKYAKELRLDLKRLRADMKSKQALDWITRDMEQGDKLGLDGTPFVFLNGRLLDLSSLTAKPLDDLAEWVSLDIELAGQTPQPASTN